MTPSEKLINKHFGIKSLDTVLQKIEEKPIDYFTTLLFIEKDQYIQNLKKLAKEIDEDGDLLSYAKEASRSGSIIQGFASEVYGNTKVSYVQKRKALVNHVSMFIKSKK